MTFTPYTLITTIVSSAVVIVVLNIYLKQVNYEALFSPAALAVILLIPLLRMVIPIEFPFTRVIRSYAVLPAIAHAMKEPLVSFGPGYGINLFYVLLIVWAAGFVYTEGKGLWKHRAFVRAFRVMDSEQDERDRRIISEYFQSRNLKPREIRLIRLPGIPTPFFFGLRQPTIILPSLVFSDRQLQDILGHELSHYIHGDLIMKEILCVLCSVYWWLPPVRTFRKWIDSIMEIRADRDVMKGRSREERDDYVDLMTYVYNSRTLGSSSDLRAAGFSGGGQDAVTRRFNAVRTPQNIRRQKWLTFLLVLAMAAVMMFSFGFVVQPYTGGSEGDHESYLIPDDGNYLVARDDGEYDLYLNNENVGKIASFENSDEFKNMPIINQQEESP